MQAPTECTEHLYQLDATDELLSGILPLAVNHKIDYKYPKLLKIPLLNTEHNTVHILIKTVIGTLQPVNKDFEVSNISCTTDGTADTTSSSIELSFMLPKSSFQLEHSNTKHPIVLHDAQILQESKDGLYTLLEWGYNSSFYKSPMDVGRTNLFQMDILTTGTPTVCKPCPILLKYQNLINQEIRLLENTGCISNFLACGLLQLL